MMKEKNSYTVETMRDAWILANKLFPTDYMPDYYASERAGYPIYKSTADGYNSAHISDLGSRLEINLPDGSTFNIWLEVWKDYEDTTHMSQAEYDELKNQNKGTEVLTTQQAIDRICIEFGFDPNKVEIKRQIPTYEVNSKGNIRRTGTTSRKPLWNATDWNYIRFDCAGWQWEMVNGSIYPVFE